MSRAEMVTADVLERELTSQRFISGLIKAIEITQRTGYEASFEVLKKIFNRKIVYPDSIHIGTHDSTDSSERMKKLRGDYEKQTGIDSRSVEGIMGFYNWVKRKDVSRVEGYPEVEPEFDYDNVFCYGSEKLQDFYSVIEVHTHPEMKSAFASEEDIMALNSMRKLFKKDFGISPGLIYVVAAGNPRNGLHELLFFQEKSEQPLDDSQLERARRFAEPDRDRLAVLFNLRKYGTPIAYPYHRNFRGALNITDKKIFLPEDLKDFEYTCEEGK